MIAGGTVGTVGVEVADARGDELGRCFVEEPSSELSPKATPPSTRMTAATPIPVRLRRRPLSPRTGRAGVGALDSGGSLSGTLGARWERAVEAADSRCQSPDQRCFGPLMRSRAT